MAKKETEFLTIEEIESLLRVPDKRTAHGKRNYSILLLMLSTGLRKAELCNLKIDDIKTYRNQHVIDVLGKGKRHRRIPLEKSVYLAIKEHLKSFNGNTPSEHLFHTTGKHGPYKQQPITPKAIDYLVKKTAQKALIKKRMHPHVLRHSFAVALDDNDTDLKTIQALMGHSSIQTTEGYLHTTDDRKIKAVGKLQFGV